MDTLASLGFRVDSKPLDTASKRLRGLTNESGKASKSQKQFAGAANLARTAVTGLVGALGAREIIRYADTWRGVENQLMQVTSSTSQLESVQMRLLSVSKDTRSSFEATGNLYARLARSTTEMGLSTEDLIGLTTTINQSFAASGATAEEASAAITQLSQGLAAGALRGDEFNSVSEQAPGIMRAIAASLGMTIGELRAFAAEGGITAEIVVKALSEASESIASDFGKTTATFGQSMEVARTNLIAFVGMSGGLNGSIQTAGESIVWLSERLIDMGDILPGMAAQWGAWGTDAQKSIQAVNEYFMLSAEDWEESSNTALDSIGDGFKNFPANVRTAIQLATVEIASFIEKMKVWAKTNRGFMNPANWIDDAAMERISAERAAGVDAVNQARLDSIKAILDEREEAVNASDAIIQGRRNERKEIELTTNALSDFGSSGKGAAEEFENPWQKTADSVAQSLQDAIASGDWDGLGDAIGNALATSIAGVVNKSITDNLAKGLTENSTVLAQIGGAFAGPIAGAVVGGAVQVALGEIEDYFGSDYDPTAQRQASQGTGTVLGEINAKSESIVNASEITANATNELVGLNRSMLVAMQAVRAGIVAGSSRIAAGSGNVDINLPGIENIWEKGIFGELVDFTADFFDFVTFDLFDFSDMVGGKSKKVDEGIEILGGYITDLMDETVVNAFATFKVKKHALDDYDKTERSQRLGGDAEDQFSAVFGGIYDSVVSAASVLGVDAANRLRNFQIEAQKISLEGLTAAEQEAELQAFFGTVFDDMASSALPFLQDFQLAGEGLGETLARLANNAAVTLEVVDMLGVQFRDLSGEQLVMASERLVELSGGLDNLISSTQNFVSNFATEAQQFELNSQTLAKAMGNLPLPETREEFFNLMQAQDASTAAGAANIATLLRVQGTADQYYKFLEKSNEEQKRAIEEQFNTVRSAADSLKQSFEPLKGLERNNALKTLERALATGDISGIGDAARAAAQINERDFSSAADFRLEQAKTLNLLERVAGLGEGKSPEVLILEQIHETESQQLQALKAISMGNPVDSAPSVNISYADMMNKLGASDALLSEIRGLRSENKASQYAIEKNTREIKLIQDSWDRIGLPEERSLA